MRTTVTLGTFISPVRELLRDTSTPARHYSDDAILAGIVAAFEHLFAARPEARYGNSQYAGEIAFPTENLSSFSVIYDSKWKRGIIYYATSCCYETGITDTIHRELADALRQKADLEFSA